LEDCPVKYRFLFLNLLLVNVLFLNLLFLNLLFLNLLFLNFSFSPFVVSSRRVGISRVTPCLGSSSIIRGIVSTGHPSLGIKSGSLSVSARSDVSVWVSFRLLDVIRRIVVFFGEGGLISLQF
jgi:hypothetical protein